jgi:nucleotide-binding universal stress UspA family protein
MPEYAHIVLASHGTPGAQAAEQVALGLLARGARLSQLVVVPDLWKGMMGDDWLNNASTRDVFGRHVERQLEREIAEQVARVRAQADARGLRYEVRTELGKPAQCLIEFAAGLRPDLVVIGSPRPRGVRGIRSRMDLEALVRALAAPLLIAPYPR